MRRLFRKPIFAIFAVCIIIACIAGSFAVAAEHDTGRQPGASGASGAPEVSERPAMTEETAPAVPKTSEKQAEAASGTAAGTAADAVAATREGAPGDNAAPPAEDAASGQTSSAHKVKLFGTVEFKRPLSSLPGWTDLLQRNKASHIFSLDQVFKKNVTWKIFQDGSKGKKSLELLRHVNAFWNTWPYKTDIVNWGKEDYWAIPMEFLKKSGDCEDYAIVKYFSLKELGVPAEDMRIVVVRDTVRNLAHAVLVVYLDDNAYVLDNVSSAVLPHSRVRQYSPQYSINELSRWAHIKGRTLN